MKRERKEGGASERILETTFRLLSERGYARVSLRDIAGEAGVAVSQIAYYFRNKKGLFTAVIERTVRVIVEEAGVCLRQQMDKKDWSSAVKEFAGGFMKRHPQHLRVMMDLLVQSQWEPGFREEIARLFRRMEETAGQRLEGEKINMRAAFSSVIGALMGMTMQGMLGFRGGMEATDMPDGLPVPV